MHSIPTEDDWRSEPWCLDAEQAYRHLAGKTREEAAKLFCEESMLYQEYVMFMPLACLSFYARAYVDYLTSEEAKGDSDGAHCFLGLIEIRMEDVANSGREFALLIIETLDQLGKTQVWYDADESIYGSFNRRAEKLIGKLRSKINQN